MSLLYCPYTGLPAIICSVFTELFTGLLLDGWVRGVRGLLPLLQGVRVRGEGVGGAQGRIAAEHLVIRIGRGRVLGSRAVAVQGLLVGGRGGAVTSNHPVGGGGVPGSRRSIISGFSTAGFHIVPGEIVEDRYRMTEPSDSIVCEAKRGGVWGAL